MGKTLAAAAMLGLFGVAAYAAEVQGKVQGVDESSRTILLEDGTSYTAAESIDLAGVPAGSKVRITFDESTMQATMVEIRM